MTELHHSMTTCDLTSLPLKVLAHTPALSQTSKAEGFLWCRRNHSLPEAPCSQGARFAEHGIPICGKALTESLANKCPEKITCAKQSFPDSDYKLHSYAIPKTECQFKVEQIKAFYKHKQCLNAEKQVIKSLCLGDLVKECTSSKIVAYKALRTNMETIGAILERDPDTHVIYLVRDPRAIVLSTLGAKLLGEKAEAAESETGSVVLEAQFLCAKIRADLRQYFAMKARYPGAIKLIRYEDLARRSDVTANAIYDHIGMSIHPAVQRWIEQSKRSSKQGGIYSTVRSNWTASIDRWRQQVSTTTINQMNEQCHHVLETLGYSQ